MADDDRIARLEAKIAELEAEQSRLYEQLAEAQLDQWKGRLEDLEVQAQLGAMDANDRVHAVVQQARERWSEAKVQLTGKTSRAGDVVETVRNGLETALGDIRRALVEARDKART